LLAVSYRAPLAVIAYHDHDLLLMPYCGVDLAGIEHEGPIAFETV